MDRGKCHWLRMIRIDVMDTPIICNFFPWSVKYVIKCPWYWLDTAFPQGPHTAGALPWWVSCTYPRPSWSPTTAETRQRNSGQLSSHSSAIYSKTYSSVPQLDCSLHFIALSRRILRTSWRDSKMELEGKSMLIPPSAERMRCVTNWQHWSVKSNGRSERLSRTHHVSNKMPCQNAEPW
jgi:hypothetical protein